MFRKLTKGAKFKRDNEHVLKKVCIIVFCIDSVKSKLNLLQDINVVDIDTNVSIKVESQSNKAQTNSEITQTNDNTITLLGSITVGENKRKGKKRRAMDEAAEQRKQKMLHDEEVFECCNKFE